MDIIKKLYLSQEEWKHVGNSALMSTILDNVQPESRDVGDGGLGLVEVTKAIAEKYENYSEKLCISALDRNNSIFYFYF